MKEENRELVIKYKNDVLRYDAWKRVLLIFGISFAIATVVLVAIFSVTYALIFSILIAAMKDAGQKIDFSWNGSIFWIPALTLQVSIASFILRATLLNKLIERRRKDIAKLEKEE